MSAHRTDEYQTLSDIELENLLQKKLHPIKPRPEFVNKVKSRIVSDPYIMLEHSQDFSLFYILIIGLIAGLAAILVTRLINRE